jgi:DNA polymerase, archaea type
VNSAYGYLGAVGLTRFADVHAANEVTRHGRELLSLLCRELRDRGVTLLEADTDGVYFAVPESFTEADERRVVAEVGALLPPRVKLEFEGRYRAMLSHEPKNYALLSYEGRLVLRGVAFRSRRAEPFGEEFLRRALDRLFASDVSGVRDVYVATMDALRRRTLPTSAVCADVRLTKTPAQYAAAPKSELPYDAMLAAGRATWSVGERVRVYRASEASGIRAGLFTPRDASDDDDDANGETDRRDYDVEFYARLLRRTFATRLACALAPADFATAFADPNQLSLFDRSLAEARPILTVIA